MTISAYTYVLYGNRYDLPYRECILSALPVVDEFAVLTDSRFDDGTLESLSALAHERPKVKVYVKELDLSNPGIDGATKTMARSFCEGEYLLQMDADEVLRQEDYPKLLRAASIMHNLGLDLTSCGVINWFCGKRLKLSDGGVPTGGWVKERLSRNAPHIIHGIPVDCRKHHPDGRVYTDITLSDGAGYIDRSTGERLESQRAFCVNRIPDAIRDPRQIWVHHLSWYNPIRHWDMKPTWHYFWGLLNGDYLNLEDYHRKGNPDGEKQSLWEPYPRKEDYSEDFKREFEKGDIAAFDSPMPEVMAEWLERHDEQIERWMPQN